MSLFTRLSGLPMPLPFFPQRLFDGTAIDAGRAAEPLNKLTAPHGVYLSRETTSSLGTTASICGRSRRPVCACLATKGVGGRLTDYWCAVPERHARRAPCVGAARHRLGSRPREHPADACARPSGDRGSCRRFFAVVRHTHVGQFIPRSWMARRIYRQFVYGLIRIGKMQVFTSSGAGTWGPPLRLGSNPEIVVLKFE